MHKVWFSTRDGREMHGPWTSKELKRMASTGQLLPTDKVLKDGMEKAVRARRIKGLFPPPAAPEGVATP